MATNTSVENKKERKMQPIGFLLFLTFIFIVFSALMYIFYANTAKSLKIFNANRLVDATFIDVQETSKATVPITYSYKPFTLVFEFVDTDGTVYTGTDRKYDTEKLARMRLGETKKIRIDGEGNFIDGSITAVKPNGFLISGIVCTIATILCLLGATVYSEKTRDIAHSLFDAVMGDNRPVVAMITFIFLIFLIGIGTGFFASGIQGINGVIERNEFIKNATAVEATFVCLVDERVTPNKNRSTLAGWAFRYEYVDNENEDLVYTGQAGFISVRASLQEIAEIHNQHIGSKIEVLIDGQGNSMLAGSKAENPIDNSYFWVGIAIYAVDLCLMIVYLIARFRKAEKTKNVA